MDREVFNKISELKSNSNNLWWKREGGQNYERLIVTGKNENSGTKKKIPYNTIKNCDLLK